MPKVIKQVAHKKKASSNSAADAWDNIEPVHEIEQGLTMALYGKSGTGKTRFACTATKPILLLGSEDGTKSIRTDPGVDFKRLRDTEEINYLVEGLVEGRSSRCMPGKPYQSFILDTGSMLQDKILCQILGLNELPEQKEWGTATQQQYGQCSAQWKEFVRHFLDLSCSNLMNIIIICQERNFTEGEDAERIAPTIGSALFPSLTGWLHPACDYVAQTFIRRKMVEKDVIVNKKKVGTRLQPTKDVEFCLRTGVHDIYQTKFRVPRGQVLPEVIVNPDFSKVLKLINGEA